MSNIVQLQQQLPSAYTLDQLERMAVYIADSGLFSVKNPKQAVALMLIAQAEGAHPATIAEEFDIIQGQRARKTNSVLARFQAAGGKVQWHELTDTKAEATFSHPSGGSVKIDWTIERANKARLTDKDNWKKYPRAMLRARVIAEGVRTVYPAAIGGMRVVEEVLDADPVTGSEFVEVEAKPEIQMPKAKPAPAEVVAKNVTMADSMAAAAQDVIDVEPNPAPASEPASLPVEDKSDLASDGAKKFILKKLGDRDPVEFAKSHGVDWNHLTVTGFATLKGAL